MNVSSNIDNFDDHFKVHDVQEKLAKYILNTKDEKDEQISKVNGSIMKGTDSTDHKVLHCVLTHRIYTTVNGKCQNKVY